MKKLIVASWCLQGLLLASISHAADLKQSKFTQVVNDVGVISSADNSEKPAVVDEMFSLPDLVRTGAASRAELVAADNTVTRVGANTIFSFDPSNRTIDLQRGSLLFHSPKGKGGGTIRTGSATASVLGTTLIVTTTSNGGFKVIDLEGHVAIQFLNGLREDLRPGEMTFVLRGGIPSPVIVIRLDSLVDSSLLVNGFAQPLSSLALIRDEIAKQRKLLKSGRAQDTGWYVGDEATPTTVQVIQTDTIADSRGSYQPSSPPPGGTPSPPTPTPPTPPSPPSPPTAVTISSPTLDPTYITNTGSGYEFAAPASLPNIIIETSTIDLSPYASPTPTFEFSSPDALTIDGSVVFSGLPSSAPGVSSDAAASSFSTLDLVAGTQLSIASGSTVEADVGIFALTVTGSNGMTFNDANILDNATGGRILIGALGVVEPTISTDTPPSFPRTASISMTGGSVQAQSAVDLLSTNDISVSGSTLAANAVEINSSSGGITLSDPVINCAGTYGEADISAETGLTANGATINTDQATGYVDMSTNSGLLSVQNSTITTSYLSLYSGDGILLDGGTGSVSGGTLNGGGTGSAYLYAAGASGGSLTVNNADFTSFSYVSMSANTINLTNVNLGSTNTINFTSLNGVLAPNPNTNAASVPGDVNFIKNVTYGGSPAQFSVATAQGGSYEGSSTAPIAISSGTFVRPAGR